jgi:hypothetical protein
MISLDTTIMMDKPLSVSKRRVVYVNSDTKTLETSVAFFEKRLQLISNLELIQVSSLDLIDSKGQADLVIINAPPLEKDGFLRWVEKIGSKLGKDTGIPVPCIFFSRLTFSNLEQMWETFYKQNWYFDILHPEHMDSLPIRLANLLRIHDHLHEIHRYERELQDLHKKLSELEKNIKKMSRNEPN